MSRSLRSLFFSCLATGVLAVSQGAQASPSACDGLAFNLVANCGFETGDFTGWTTTNVDPFFNASGIQANAAVGPLPVGPVHSGTYSAYFGNLSDTPGTITQTLVTVPGTTYTISYYLEVQDNFGAPTANGVQSSFGGTVLDQLSNIAPTAYALHTFTVTASAASTVLSLSFFDEPSLIDLDDVSVLAVATPPRTVPEPGAIALLALAGTAGVLQGRRRKTGRAL